MRNSSLINNRLINNKRERRASPAVLFYYLCQCDHVLLDDSKYVFPFHWAHAITPGEPAECGQDAMLSTKVKTGEAQYLLATPPDGDGWMNMTGEGKTAFIDNEFGFEKIVDKGEWPYRKGIVMDGYIRFFVPSIIQDIVIALRQMNIERGEILAPFAEKVHLEICDAMTEIAHDN